MTHGENVWVDNKKWQPAEPSHCIRKKLKRVNLKFAEDQTIHSLAQSKQAGWPDASTLQHQWRDGEERKEEEARRTSVEIGSITGVSTESQRCAQAHVG